MKTILFFCAALLLFVAHPALATDNSTVFPPVTLQNQACGSDQLRVISWSAGSASTICLTGQEVLNLAIPTCSANQQVTYDGTNFVCRSTARIPTCTSGQYLTYNGNTYECKSSSPPPTCLASQVLTYDGTTYSCVDRSESIPACASNEFLTYNGQSYQCAASSQVSVPTCGPHQVVTADGKQFTCRDEAAAGDTATSLDPGWPDIIRCKEANSGWIENIHLFETMPDGSHVYALDISGQGEIIFNPQGVITSTNGYGLGGDNTCFHHTMQQIIANGWGYNTVSKAPAHPAYSMPLQ